MAPGIPGIPNDVQGPAPDAPFRRSPRCSDTSDEPENLSYAKHSILSDKLLTAYTRHGLCRRPVARCAHLGPAIENDRHRCVE
jgi:hypothetical protein